MREVKRYRLHSDYKWEEVIIQVPETDDELNKWGMDFITLVDKRSLEDEELGIHWTEGDWDWVVGWVHGHFNLDDNQLEWLEEYLNEI